MSKFDLTVIILTFNEEIHIRRVIQSVKEIASVVWVVDSYSTDKTIAIAEMEGARTVKHVFTNHAAQFQWALDHCDITSAWVMRMDADEYLTDALVSELKTKLKTLGEEITGIVLKRQVHFMGQWIRYGGYYPVKLLRIWRKGSASIEKRWMDEHIVLSHGNMITLEYDFVDDNLNSLSWWTTKHNDYATREAIDLLNRKYHLFDRDTRLINSKNEAQFHKKRWYKEKIYLILPPFLRCFIYFQFRYWIKLGFLDGRRGLVWHFLQGFWYRFLVDAKILQIEWLAKKENKSIKQILEEYYGVRI